MRKFFRIRGKIKELEEDLKSEREYLSNYMTKKKTNRLVLDVDNYVTRVQPESISFDIPRLRKVLGLLKVRKRAIRTGYVKNIKDLIGSVIQITESVDRKVIEEMLEAGVLTEKDVGKFMSTRALTSYIK